MGKKDSNWERFYQKLNMIFHGIIAISLIPFAWVFLETQKEMAEGPLIFGTTATLVQTLLIVLTAGIIGYSRTFGKSVLKNTQHQKSIHEKLKAYLNGKLRHYFLLEFAAVLAVGGLYLTKNQLFSLIYILVLFVFSLGRPSFDKVSRETGIPEKDLKAWGEGSDLQ